MNRLTMHILKRAYRRNDMTMTMNIQNSYIDSHTICIFVYRLSTSAPGTMRILAFDAHNHIHLGRSSVPLPTIFAGCTSSGRSSRSSCSGSGAEGSRLGGIAIMSTHPRDYPTVLELSRSIPWACRSLHDIEVKVVPCFGVHPWFLHELNVKDVDEDDVATRIAHQTTLTINHESDHHQTTAMPTPMWLQELEHWIKSTPEAIVGEIGI